MTALLLVLSALLVALNAFFVIAEYALVRSRPSRLEAEAERGERGARLAVQLLDDINEYISVCQVGVTMASIGIGALGIDTLATLLQHTLKGPLGHTLSVVISLVIGYLFLTSLQVIVGELVPKIYAIDRAESLLRRIGRPLRFSRLILSPFSTVYSAIAARLLRALGVDPTMRLGEEGSPEELKVLIAQARTGGALDPGEATMLTGVFELHEQEARQVMTPFPAVVTVDLSEDVETALQRSITSGHTRLVVTEDDNRDRVRGIVHSNQLARVLMSDGPRASLDGVVNDAVIVPETKPLDDLLADLQRERSTMAVVVDEYGRVAGIVTVEDIVEEVVGEVFDETDPAGGEVRRLANGDWFVRGHVAVTDLANYGLELPVDTDAYNSVGGFVFAHLGRLPRRGDIINEGGYSIRVESVRENRIESVRIRERRAAPTPAGGRGGDE
jgi:CBS domain containing-hemolysin-like protein